MFDENMRLISLITLSSLTIDSLTLQTCAFFSGRVLSALSRVFHALLSEFNGRF